MAKKKDYKKFIVGSGIVFSIFPMICEGKICEPIKEHDLPTKDDISFRVERGILVSINDSFTPIIELQYNHEFVR